MTTPQYSPPAAPEAIPDNPPRVKPIVALGGMYRLLLRQQLTKGRVLLALVMGALGILVCTIIARESEIVDVVPVVEFLSVFALGLAIPILSLVLASSSLGHLVEDETLVYLWLRPAPRWILALSAYLASLTVALPSTVVPFSIAAWVGLEGDTSGTLALAYATALAVVAYCGIFVFIGLILRRSLIWGLLYVFIWEFFVARAGQGAARLSINTYPSSLLSRLTEVELPLAERSMTAAITVPPVVAVIAVGLTAWQLNRANVA